MGDDPMAGTEDGEYEAEEEDDSGMPTMEEMMREAMADEEGFGDDDDDADEDDEEGADDEALDEDSTTDESDDKNTE